MDNVHRELIPAKKIMRQALIDEVIRSLFECTKEQEEFFHKIFPNFKSCQDVDKLITAVDLCHRTIVKNREGRIKKAVD